MEPVRPQVDGYLLDWITTQPLKREWFLEQPNGNARLMSFLTEKLSETAPTWARAVAPIGERVAQALCSSAGKSASEGLNVPPRLTQRHRSEGRGNKFQVGIKPVPRPMTICEVCGAEDVKNRHCKTLHRRAFQREHGAGCLDRSRLKTRRVKARMSKKISDHAVANTWWDRRSLPSWLTEECYVQKVQPLLKNKKVREIAQAMQVSQPYAALIRAQRRPHPRHWQVLTKLAGISESVSNCLLK
jgi:hypothetical protein